MKPSSFALLQSTVWLSLSACGSTHPVFGGDDAAAAPRADAALGSDAPVFPSEPDAAVSPDAMVLADAGVAALDAAEPADAAVVAEDTRYCWTVDDANVFCRG